MSLTVRRVVTGHDENGRAIVSINEISKNIVQGRPPGLCPQVAEAGRAPPNLRRELAR
jgi:hypothetical protein